MPTALPKKMAETLLHYQMVKKGSRVLVAFSGGPDSLALLCAFLAIKAEWSLELACAHLDHGLRGEASRQDADWAEDFCRRQEVPFFRGYWPGHKEVKTGQSPEAAARKARRIFLEETLQDWGGQVIALGHHRDDQAETVLIHMINGSGLRGLGGIWPVRPPYIRPLLEVSRREILDYVAELGLVARQDSSNEDQAYLRNRLRRQVIPVLKECNPRFGAAVSRLTELVRQEDRFLDGLAAQALEKMLHPLENLGILELLAGFDPASERKKGLDIKALLALDPVLARRVLRLWLDKETDYAAIQRIYDLAAAGRNGARAEAAGGLRVRREKDCLILEETKEETKKERLPGFREQSILPGRPLAIAGGRAAIAVCRRGEPGHSGCVLPERILDEYICCWPPDQGWPLLRRRRPGDWLLLPYGRKKLKELYNEKKIPREMREFLPLLAWGSQVLWVPGLIKALGPFDQGINEGEKACGKNKNPLQYIFYLS